MSNEEKSKSKFGLPSICHYCGAGGVARSRFADLKARFDEEEGLAKDYLSRLQWLQAEFENLKKRSSKEREEYIEFANESLVSKLLDALDNLERAVESAKRSEAKESFVQGLEMIYEQFRDILKREGLTPIEAVGKVLDPFEHEAVEQVQSADHEDGMVIEEVQRGYKFKSKILRPSKVKVVKNPKNK